MLIAKMMMSDGCVDILKATELSMRISGAKWNCLYTGHDNENEV